jgi:hypothetical protein
MATVCLAGCHSYGYAGGDYGYYGVGTYYGPYWYPANYGTFTVVRYPWWGDPPPPPENDPMTPNTVTQRAIAEQIRESITGRGYQVVPSDGDVDVAVYASSRPGELDITGYTHEYNWKNLPKLKNKTKYPRGTVIVDVLAPKTHELLWRGETVAPVSTDTAKYEADLRKAVERVVEKYPKAKH